MGKSSKKSRKSENFSSNSEAVQSEKKSEVKSTESSNTQNEKSELDKTKKIRSFKDLLEAMKPSVEELKFRENKSKETNGVEDYSSLIRCTKCSTNFYENSMKVQTHPCLGVLMCEKCCKYYGDGEFSLDSENEDKYCRWCGEGGTLFGCSRCICGFCMTCIKKHFGIKYLKKVVEDDDWLCFFCNPKPLWNERYICSIALQMSQNKEFTPSSKSKSRKKGSEKLKNAENPRSSSKKKKQSKNSSKLHSGDSTSSSIEIKDLHVNSLQKKNTDNSRKRVYSTSSDESEMELFKKKLKKMSFSHEQLEKLQEGNVSFENLKQITLEKLEKIVKLTEYQMAFGLNWSSKALKKLGDPNQLNTPKDLQDECQKIKWFLSVLSTYLLEFCNSVDSIEKNLAKENGPMESNNSSQSETDLTSFSTIIKFLSFIITQVNTFVKKGLNLTDVLQAEIYDDDKVIGIKKNQKLSGVISDPTQCCTSSERSEANFRENNKGGQPSTEAEDKNDSPDEDSFRLVVDQGSEAQENEGESESTEMSNPVSISKDVRKDIQQIIEILEHA